MLRNLIRGDARQLREFWDTSSKRAYALSRLARGLGLVEVHVAQSFGLFCDIGIPLLLQRFADYGQTLIICRSESERCFTAPEQDRHHADHAQIDAMMARSWGLSPTLCLSIGLHHDYSVLVDAKVPETVARRLAMICWRKRRYSALPAKPAAANGTRAATMPVVPWCSMGRTPKTGLNVCLMTLPMTWVNYSRQRKSVAITLRCKRRMRCGPAFLNWAKSAHAASARHIACQPPVRPAKSLAKTRVEPGH